MKHPMRVGRWSPDGLPVRMGRWLLSGLLAATGAIAAPEPIVVGLDADLSSGSAQAGEAIRRGALIAIAEINEGGGLLGGRRLQLVARDHRGTPTRSADNLLELASTENLVAVLGGLHSPAIIQNHQLIHDHKLVMLVPWSAATAVVDKAPPPGYVFRISVRDEWTGPYLTEQALARGYRRPAFLLEKTGWGRGNEHAIRAALKAHDLDPATVQWFNLGDTDLMPTILAIENAKADVILMVANAPEGAAAVRAIAKRPGGLQLPVISHWGITGGNFTDLAGDALRAVELLVLQTYSFIDAKRPRAREVLQRYREMFGPERAEAIPAPVGTAHAYDLIHVLALAIEKAGTIERDAVRDALEQIESYAGLVRDYRPPFRPDRHEGLAVTDFRLARYRADGALVPLATRR